MIVISVLLILPSGGPTRNSLEQTVRKRTGDGTAALCTGGPCTSLRRQDYHAPEYDGDIPISPDQADPSGRNVDEGTKVRLAAALRKLMYAGRVALWVERSCSTGIVLIGVFACRLLEFFMKIEKMLDGRGVIR